jgi:putative glutamine amidotransferase
MKSPLIGVTTKRSPDPDVKELVTVISEAYVQALIDAGATPVLIPLEIPNSQLFDLENRLDGILFTGGGDIDPRHYSGASHPRVGDIDEDRDRIEIQLALNAAQIKLPFLAICRGIQIVNVALGGDLYSDITDQKPKAIRHDYYPDWPRNHLAHSVEIKPNSHLAKILGAANIQVNSLHHQGINQIAPSLIPTAYAPDGLVEAVELDNHPFGIGVQWHPEWLLNIETMRALFEQFTQSACEYLTKRQLNR